MQIIQPTTLTGPLLIQPRVHPDERGFFTETFRENTLAQAGIQDRWVQDNHSRSTQGVLRGMHFYGREGIAKLVRCVNGAIYDVLVDVRPKSPQFGQWEGFTLDDKNLCALYVPHGFAHGFCVISPQADVVYKQSEYYDPARELGISYCDPKIGIQWPDSHPHVVSERDRDLPTLFSLNLKEL